MPWASSIAATTFPPSSRAANSSGWRWRARSSCNPSLILADEPTGNLDSRSTHDVLGLFDRLHAEGRTVVIITHEDDVAARAGRIVRMADGRVVSDSGARVFA